MRQEQPIPGTSLPQDKVITREFIFLCATNFLFFMTVYSFLVTLPVYSVVLGGGEGQAGFVTAAMSAVTVLSLPYLGRLVDRFGRAPLMRLGLGVLLAEALALNFVSWLPLLVATSAFIGAAVASFQTGATTLVADLAPVHRRGQAMGIFGTFTTTAVALSPAVATFVMRGIGFTALFAMSAVLAVSGLLLSLTVREPPRRAGTYTKGALLHPAGFLPGLCIFGVTVTYGALISFLPGQAPQMGLENAGLFFTVFAFSTILVRAVAGSVSDRVGRAPVILPALFLVAAAMVLLGQSTGPAMILAVGFMYGLGYGSAHPTVMALAVDRGGPDARASAVATFNVSYNLGLAAGSLAMGFLLAATSFALMAAVAGAIPFLALATLYVRRGPVTKPP